MTRLAAMTAPDNFTVSLVLTSEQVKSAPREVRQWLFRLLGAEDPTAFVVERNGFRYTEDNLAICSEAEISAIYDRICIEPVATQILFQFGCNSYDPATGAVHAHRVHVGDFLRYTDLRNATRLDGYLDMITAALRAERNDPAAQFFEHDHHSAYWVHELTQSNIHRLWEKLAKPALTLPRPAAGMLPKSSD
jgi:hypothetical protein